MMGGAVLTGGYGCDFWDGEISFQRIFYLSKPTLCVSYIFFYLFCSISKIFEIHFFCLFLLLLLMNRT